MLSITLPMHGVGHANYYVELAQKDYYTAQGNDPGAWFGRGAAKLGLTGEVDSQAYAQLLWGRSPDGRRELVQNAGGAQRQTAWDLTFSAPKSVSVLWALGSDEVRGQIEAAHRQAVEAALSFLEETTGLTRRGKGGTRMESADLVFALFPHYSSRAFDPQVHTHALLINLAVRQDGTTGALWSQEFFRAKMAAGAVYQVQFATGLREGPGLVTEPARIGFQIAAVPKEVCRAFSQRGEAIRAVLDEHQSHDARTAKQVTLDTRPHKVNIARAELTARWRTKAEPLGWNAERVSRLLHQDRVQPCAQRDLEQRFHAAAARLPAPQRTLGRGARAECGLVFRRPPRALFAAGMPVAVQPPFLLRLSERNRSVAVQQRLCKHASARQNENPRIISMKTIKAISVAAMLALAGWTECRGALGPAPVPDDAPAMTRGAEVPNRVEGELLVKFRGGPRGDAARRVQAEFGHTVLRDFEFIGWQHIKLPVGMSVDETLILYKQDPDVLAAEPNCLVKIEEPLAKAVPVSLPKRAEKDDLDPIVPNDPMFPQQWGLSNICASQAWSITTGSTNVIVAVLDTGVNYLHEDLAANMWHNPGEIPGNGIDDDGNGYVDDEYGADTKDNDGDPMDQVTASFGIYHGTGCAGIVGAIGNNGIGLAGLNWHVRIMGVRYSNGGGWSGWASEVAGLDYILGLKLRGENVRVVNMSHSWPGQDGGYSLAQKDAIEALGIAGVVSVIAAKNEATDIDATPYYPAAYASPHIISVAASGATDRLADFSNWGRTNVDLAAPGAVSTNIIMASGPTPTSYTTFWGGTSSATPHVAGVVALLAAAYPDASVAQIKAAILDTVDVIEPLKGLMVTGGRLNVARALLHLSTNQPPIFVVPPQGKSVFPGSSVSLTASVGGTPPLAYQWFQGSNGLAGATNAFLAFTNLTASQTGVWVQVSNAFGSVTSAPLAVVASPKMPPVVAWGASQYGQCDVPADLTNLVSAAGGRWHTVATRSDGTVAAWGWNYTGQLGVPPGLSGVRAVSASTYASVALRSNGTVTAWGDKYNWYGEANAPSSLSDVAAIASGQYHHLALQSNGTVVAWGRNEAGQCNVPGGLADAVAVSGGFNHSLAVLQNGTVRAWGDNSSGQCSVPAGLTDVVSVVAGTYASLALKRDGMLVAWGGNPNGELSIPAGLSNVVAITGYAHFMALKNDGTVVAWGAGVTDQKSGQNWGQAIVPPGLTNVIAISSNGRHSLAVLARPQLPALAFQMVGNNAMLSWPEVAAGWQLLSTTNPASPADWQPWPVSLSTNQGTVFTPITPSDASRFFRLRSP